ncbi:MAG: HAD-IA family hydrolase [Planctomyces sp.]|nr:HAD-IA family hydrolase [Planctomyces sp.]
MNSDGPLAGIRAVVFDAVGTVIFADPPIHMAYHRVGRKFGSRIAPEDCGRRFREAFSRASAGRGDGDSLATTEDAEREFWRTLVDEVLPDLADPDACFDALFQHFAEPAAWGVYADVEDTLAELRRRGLKLGIASNFDRRLHPVLDGRPELRGLELRLISSEVGWKKPAAPFFEAVVAACGVRPEEILFIGDDPVNDVQAARAAGMRALLIARGGTPAADTLTSLEDVLENS